MVNKKLPELEWTGADGALHSMPVAAATQDLKRVYDRYGFGITEMLDRLDKLEAFYKDVARMTEGHDVLNDHAVVYPSKLGRALEKVDPDWLYTLGIWSRP